MMNPTERLRQDWPIWLLLIAPFVVIAIYWNEFPAQIPVHWNIRGEVDGYAGRYKGLFLLPLINIGIYGLFWIMPIIDPKRKVSLTQSSTRAVRFLSISLFTGLSFINMFTALGYVLNSGRLLFLLLIFLFLALGNYMGSLRHNYFVGVRTPWTLEHEDIWRKTHRLAARVWVVSSIVMLILWFVMRGPLFNRLFLAYVAVIILVPVIHSYLLYANLRASSEETE